MNASLYSKKEFLQLQFRPMDKCVLIFFLRCLFLISDYIKHAVSCNEFRPRFFTIKDFSFFRFHWLADNNEKNVDISVTQIPMKIQTVFNYNFESSDRETEVFTNHQTLRIDKLFLGEN